MMDIEEILQYLPHRYPFLLVDRVLELEENKRIVALKNVTINESFFTGHFPQKAVMPGVLMLEALAQAAAILAYKSTGWKADESLFYLGSIDSARFKKIIVPGDQLILKIDVLKQRNKVWKFLGTILVSDEVACIAEVTSAEGRNQRDS